MSRMVSFLVLLAIIVVIGVLFYRVMAGFLLPMFLAALLVVMFRPLHHWFLAKWEGHPRLAAGLTTVTVMLIVLAPTILVMTFAAVEASSLVTQFNNRAIREKVSALRTSLGLEMPYSEELRYFEASFSSLLEDAASGAMSKAQPSALAILVTSLEEFENRLLEGPFAGEAPRLAAVRAAVGLAVSDRVASVDYQQHIHEAARRFRSFKVSLLGGEYRMRVKELANPTPERIDVFVDRALVGASDWLRTIGGTTGAWTARLLFGVVIMVIALHFFLADGPTMISSIMRLSPLDDRHEQELLAEFDRVSRAVVVATLLSAAVQGLLAGAGFWLAGLDSVFLLMLLTTVFAMIPFVGAASVWIPACLYLVFIEERYLAAGLLALYGAGIVSMADNVIKPLVLHGQSNLHPLLALLSVLGGVQALGPIGVLVGPMVVVFLQTLLNILHRELTVFERHRSDRHPVDDTEGVP